VRSGRLPAEGDINYAWNLVRDLAGLPRQKDGAIRENVY
jgi:hypothetical protein